MANANARHLIVEGVFYAVQTDDGDYLIANPKNPFKYLMIGKTPTLFSSQISAENLLHSYKSYKDKPTRTCHIVPLVIGEPVLTAK